MQSRTPKRVVLQSGCQPGVTIRLWETKAEAKRLLPLSLPPPCPQHRSFRIPDLHLSHRLPAGCPAGSFRLTVRISNQVGHKASIQGLHPGTKKREPHKGAGQPHNGQTNEQTPASSSNTRVCTHRVYGQGSDTFFFFF